MAYYLDTSALVKLVVAEDETPALRAWLVGGQREPVSSDLARAEVVRAVRRATPDRLVRARAVLEAITLVAVSTATFEAAGRLEPPVLRSLDAIHLAAALGLGDDLEGLLTYGDRLAAAATSHGVPVVAPGGPEPGA